MRLILTPLFALALLLAGCGSAVRDDPTLWSFDRGNLSAPDVAVTIPGLGPCTDNPDRTLHLNSRQPATILVHGCFASSGRFRALAQVYAFHGQQTACFNYDDRDSMMRSSSQLIEALEQFGQVMQNKNVTLIGHSQGGLIARKALIQERDRGFGDTALDIHLVTISSPFRGIAAADHCGSTTARVLSLGLVVPICYAISGGKWFEITSASQFIRQPGTLIPQVNGFLKIVTDERNTCRKYNDEGACVEDDYVFSVAEQYYEPVDRDGRVDNVQLRAGHVEIVGDRHVAPKKLIALLQDEGLLRQTPEAQRRRFDRLLGRLYDLSATQ